MGSPCPLTKQVKADDINYRCGVQAAVNIHK